MGRFIAFFYGLAAYALFFVTILFVTGLVVPKTIDTGMVVPAAQAIIVNLILMSAFAIQPRVLFASFFWRSAKGQANST